MGYGQHQSFYLRINWLRKAIKNIENDNRFLYREEAAEKIGLGKNMVQSLRHWVVATGIAEVNNKAEQEISEFGKLMNNYDPYVELIDTASIIHFHLVDAVEPCTAWYWYFNHYAKKLSTKEEIIDDFLFWLDKNEPKKPSVNSIKRDIDCLVRLYCDKGKNEDPEEVIQSPLSGIGLLIEEKSVITKKNLKYSDIGLGALMYTLLDYQIKTGINQISVEDIQKQDFLWGKVFHLPRNEIIKALDLLTHHPYSPIRFDRTNRLDTILLPKINPLEFLEEEYKRYVRERI
ncbi:DUF4007 family protein [Paenibacillus sp. DYY-L-2]|uniref:DUF4007 family protein n=1 Tax=Paenibacillus sp. DYY-L-2 TaxID=3447013 RepID=UPI003F501D38